MTRKAYFVLSLLTRMAPDPNSNGGAGSGKREETSIKVPSKDLKKKDEKKDEDLVSLLLF